ncbi:hypothetical protein ACFSTC_06910 [Nonomuraea ferruginea]
MRAIAELTDPAQHAPMAARAAEGSVEVLLQPQAQPFMVVEGTAEELAALAEDPRVTSIHRDRAYPPALASSIAQIGADQAHAAGHTGAGQNIAILDTGVDLDHPFLSGRVVAEACFSAVDAGVESLCPNGQTSQVGAGSADATTAKCLLDGTNLCDHGTHVARHRRGHRRRRARRGDRRGAGVQPGQRRGPVRRGRLPAGVRVVAAAGPGPRGLAHRAHRGGEPEPGRHAVRDELRRQRGGAGLQAEDRRAARQGRRDRSRG